MLRSPPINGSLATSLARQGVIIAADGSAAAKAILAKEVALASDSLSTTRSLSNAFKIGAEFASVGSFACTGYEVSSGEAGVSKLAVEGLGLGIAVVNPAAGLGYAIGVGILDAGALNDMTKEIGSIFE